MGRDGTTDQDMVLAMKKVVDNYNEGVKGMDGKVKFSPQIVLGIIVLTVGVILLLDRLDVLSSRDYLQYWPVLVILYGVSRLTQPCGSRGFGIAVTIIGLILLMDTLEIVDVGFWDLWPLILVMIGGSIVWRAMSSRRGWVDMASADTDSFVRSFAFMAGIERSNSSQDFRGGELSAIMGGIELDLRNAVIKEEQAVLDVYALWAGIEIRVPEEWNVVASGVPLMGGLEDKTRRVKQEKGKTLLVRGTYIMAGLEIRN
jgi:predicted membrane protein